LRGGAGGLLGRAPGVGEPRSGRSSIKASCTKVDKSKPDLYDLAVRDHVHAVAERLVSTSEMLKHAVAEHKLTVVEAYYSLDTGEVTKLR